MVLGVSAFTAVVSIWLGMTSLDYEESLRESEYVVSERFLNSGPGLIVDPDEPDTSAQPAQPEIMLGPEQQTAQQKNGGKS